MHWKPNSITTSVFYRYQLFMFLIRWQKMYIIMDDTYLFLIDSIHIYLSYYAFSFHPKYSICYLPPKCPDIQNTRWITSEKNVHLATWILNRNQRYRYFILIFYLFPPCSFTSHLIFCTDNNFQQPRFDIISTPHGCMLAVLRSTPSHLVWSDLGMRFVIRQITL